MRYILAAICLHADMEDMVTVLIIVVEHVDMIQANGIERY